ncbi:MAG TPA: hypothetical protein PLC33_03685 [Niabella sp.]|nr:hypothetical protein [Niabella sp.]HRB94657.1 hypothetical protein [Niabella sp.]
MNKKISPLWGYQIAAPMGATKISPLLGLPKYRPEGALFRMNY